jgi:hypothetical protein
MTPAWLLDLVAAIMLAVAGVSAARLVAARPWRHGSVVIDTDVAHLLMAIAMAGMLAASLSTLPDAAWEVIFGLLTVWFAVRVVLDARASGVRALAGGHCAPHLVHSAAMLYMFLALSTPAGGMSGMAGMGAMSGGPESTMTLRYPTLAFVFVLVLAGYSIWDLDQLSSRRYQLSTARLSLAGAGIPALVAATPGATAPSGSPETVTGTGPLDAGNAAGGQRAADFLLSPAVTVGARITMGVAMVFMLIIAL